MKFICEKQTLAEAVTNISRVIPSKSSIPSLEGIHIRASGGSLTLTGYDMESGITTLIAANIEREGSIVLSARLFSDMIRKMPEDTVAVDVGDRYLTEIKSGPAEFTILGMPADEYPEMPDIGEGMNITLPQPELKSMIEQTIFAVAATDTKPVHTGSKFEIESGVLTVVSVDGHRLALRKAIIDSGMEASFVVPGKALSEIARLLSDNEGEKASLMVGKRHIVFEIGGYSVTSRLLEGNFLDYKASIPQGGSTEARISTRAFIECVERASLLISDRLRSPLKLQFEEGRVSVSCSTTVGKVNDEFQCLLTGPSVKMGFNNKFLLDALKAAGTDEIRVQINSPISPIKILPPEGDDFLFLVLPVRLPNET